MRKVLFCFIVCALFASNLMAATNFIPKKFSTVTSHDDVYPYILNNANANSNKKTNASGSVSTNATGKRNVVRRKTNARAATTAVNTASENYSDSAGRRVVQRNAAARAATTMPTTHSSNNVRKQSTVIARSTATPVRSRTQTTVRSTNKSSTSTEPVSTKRCFADYRECMEGYCQQEDTAYNRCYCSAKLAQIDSKYQDKIDNLIQQIIRLQYDNVADGNEIEKYWNQTVGVYTDDNPWTNIDNALNIAWADTQSRVRGQNAFNTGHQYCSQHLRACSYMASNLRDAYKSEIARDCATYEKSLQRIQAAAESVIESYK